MTSVIGPYLSVNGDHGRIGCNGQVASIILRLSPGGVVLFVAGKKMLCPGARVTSIHGACRAIKKAVTG